MHGYVRRRGEVDDSEEVRKGREGRVGGKECMDTGREPGKRSAF